MLNKEVCQHCHIHSNFWLGKRKYRWVIGDEKLWNQDNKVFCERVGGIQILITGKPPKNCPYYFEHQINQERSKCEF